MYVTASDETKVAIEALTGGATDYVVKTVSEEFFPLLDSEAIALTAFGAGTKWSERGTVSTATVLATYSNEPGADGPVAGSPAITRNSFGTGTAYYVGTSLSMSRSA